MHILVRFSTGPGCLRLYSQYDPLHRGVFLCLLQGGCPSDGFRYPARALCCVLVLTTTTIFFKAA